MTGRLNDALRLGATALDHATGDEHAELALRLARAAIAAARWADASEFLDRAGRPADVRTLVLRADAAHGAGRLAEAIELAARAVALSPSAPRRPGVRRCVSRVVSPDTAIAPPPATPSRTPPNWRPSTAYRPWRVRALLGLGTVEMLEEEDATRIVEAQLLGPGPRAARHGGRRPGR